MTNMLAKTKKQRTKTANRRVLNAVTVILLIILSLFILLPFYIILVTSLKNNTEAGSIPFTWIPSSIDFSGYIEVLVRDASGGALGGSSVLRGFRNTLLFVLPPTVLGLLFSSIAAYAFSKIKFPGASALFGVLMMTMMLPGIITLIPTFAIYDSLYLTQTPFPIMVPGMFGAAACVFFMRQYFAGIPNELVEAAKIDGFNHLGIFFRIMVPLGKTALIAQGILGFLSGYNDYFGPRLFLAGNPEIYTLQIALAFLKGTYSLDYNVIMAGCVIALLPTIIIYLVAQKYFVQGIATTGMKL